MKISVSLIDWLANQLSNFVIFRIVNNKASINIFKRNCCKILFTIFFNLAHVYVRNNGSH